MPDLLRGTGRHRGARMLLAAVVAALVLALAVMQISSFRESRALRGSVDQSYRRNLMLERLFSLLQDVETGQRGYALTGNADFLQPYERARPQIALVLKAFREETSDPAEIAHVRELERLATLKLRISANVIATRRDGEPERARELIATARGKRVMDEFRAEIAAFQRSEFRNQEALLRSSSSSNGRMLAWTIGIELLLAVLLATAFMAYMANLTRLMRMTATARDTSRRQVAIFDAASDAMIVIDDGNCVEGINPAALRLFGISRAQAIGRGLDQLFADGSLDTSPAAEGEGSNLSRATGIRSDGSLFEAEVAASAVQIGDGSRTLLIVRDATARNRVERMKNEFVSTVSHELRTPLTSIRGALILLDHSIGNTLEPKPLQLLTMAKSNSERLSLLIDDILSIEKIGSGSMDFQMDRIDIDKVAHDAVEQNLAYAAEIGVELILTAQAEPLPVIGDPSRLLQAFTNLISNAAKFSRKGGVVNVIAERLDDRVRISVADQGEGIPVEFRPRLFDRFSQAQGQRTSRSGTGLGLAITKAIVERHDGTIDYETAIGAGTVFRIELPLASEGKE